MKVVIMTLLSTALLAPMDEPPVDDVAVPASPEENSWRVNYKLNEFNEPTRKVDSISGVTGFGFLIRQNSVFIPLSSSASLPNTNKGKIAIRTPNGIVRLTGKFYSSSLTNKGYARLDGANGRKFIELLKRYKELKLSIKGTNGYYVTDIDCRGFTKAWRKTGWR